MSVESAPKAATNVFLSYSRRDAAFCSRLAGALNSMGFGAIYDQSKDPQTDPDMRLTAQDEWWKQIQTMIAACDVMVFIVTPASAVSQVCDDELSFARSLGKRIIAVTHHPIDFGAARQQLRALNVDTSSLDFTEEGKYASALAALRTELDEDIGWVRIGARFARLAHQWQADSRPDSQLLRAGAIVEADAWTLRRPRNAPDPGPLLVSFLEASRERERADGEERRRAVGRAFVKPAEAALSEGRYDASLRLAAAGIILADDKAMELVPERASSIVAAAAAQQLSMVLYGHGETVNSAAFSPDGSEILTASSDKTARIWNCGSGAERLVLQGHKDGVSSAVFSPDGRAAATASADKTVRLWDASSGCQQATLQHDNWVECIAFDSNGTRLATGCANNVYIWDLKDLKQTHVLRGHRSAVLRVAFNPQGDRLLGSSRSSQVRIWDLANPSEATVLDGHLVWVGGAAFSPDGKLIVTASDTTRIWDASNGSQIETLNGGHVSDACFSPDGHRVVCAHRDGSAEVWNVHRGERTGKLLGHEGTINSVVFDRAGTRAATASSDRTVRIWHLPVGPCIGRLDHEGWVIQVAAAQTGSKFLSASINGPIQIWDVDTLGAGASFKTHPTGKAIASLSPDGSRVGACDESCAHIWDSESGSEIAVLTGHDGEVESVAFNQDASCVITASKDGTACIWRTTTGERILQLVHGAPVLSASLSPLGDRAATSGGDGAVCIWDTQDGRELFRLSAQGSGANVIFTPCGSRLVSNGGDHSARVWDIASGAELARFSGHTNFLYSMSLDSRGERLLTTSWDNTARLWDMQTFRETATLRDHQGSVTSGAFSPDGRIAATGSDDATVILWDAATGRKLGTLRGHGDGIASVAFSPDGARLITGSCDETVNVWDVARYTALAGDAAETLAASLSGGRGKRTPSEQQDIMMQAAPDDLHEALLAHLEPAQRNNAARRADILARPLHENCYIVSAEEHGVHFETTVEEGDEPAAEEELDAGPPLRAMARNTTHPLVTALIVMAALVCGGLSVFLLSDFWTSNASR